MENIPMNSVTPFVERKLPSAVNTNARVMLSMMLILAACIFTDLLIGLRGVDVGTDTYVYASFFESLRGGFLPDTRFEPGFLLVTRLMSLIGLSVNGYQMVLFGILLGTAFVACRRYYDYLGGGRGYLTFVSASLMLLFFSPMFVNASINAVRQGLAALLIFAALLSFQQREWRRFIIYGLLATGFHYSSILYVAMAPLLLLNLRLLRIAAIIAFLAYCSGLTMMVVRAAVPFIYNWVMDYSLSSNYRSGVRIDFAVFSIFWYVLPFMVAPFVHKPFDKRLKDSTAVYLVMVLPFFILGWGNFSNRYLLPAYLAASLMVAAILCHNRFPPLRNPLILRGALVLSCAAFSYYVINQVVV
jgi:hypothetical protein